MTTEQNSPRPGTSQTGTEARKEMNAARLKATSESEIYEDPGFDNFEYEQDEPAPVDLAGAIEAYVRENPGRSRHELAKAFDTTPDKVAGAIRRVEGPPAATMQFPRPNKNGDWVWVYGWFFPEQLDDYTPYVSAWLGQILGSISSLASLVRVIQEYAENPHADLDGEMSSKLARAASAVDQLNALRFDINTAEEAFKDDDEEGWEDIL